MGPLLNMRRALALGGVVALSLVGSVGSAQAAGPQCGDTIHHSITLQHNLDCSSYNGDALTIDKDGVTINLNGHKITGAGGAAGHNGIYSTEDDVTIKNGTIARFDYDVYIYGGARNVVTNMTLGTDGAQSYDGLYAEYATAGSFTHIQTKNALEAIYVEYGSNNLVAHNKGTKDEFGVDIEYEAGSEATGNVSVGLSGTTYGLYDYYNYKVTWSNNVTNGGYYGAYSDYPTKVKFVGNTANNNSYAGLYVDDNDPATDYSLTASDNVFNKNDSYGIYAAYQIAGKGNKAIGNGDFDCYQARCNG
jgi:copper-binding protein NosD